MVEKLFLSDWGREIGGFREWGAEEDIWAKDEGGGTRVAKITLKEAL